MVNMLYILKGMRFHIRTAHDIFPGSPRHHFLLFFLRSFKAAEHQPTSSIQLSLSSIMFHAIHTDITGLQTIYLCYIQSFKCSGEAFAGSTEFFFTIPLISKLVAHQYIMDCNTAFEGSTLSQWRYPEYQNILSLPNKLFKCINSVSHSSAPPQCAQVCSCRTKARVLPTLTDTLPLFPLKVDSTSILQTPLLPTWGTKHFSSSSVSNCNTFHLFIATLSTSKIFFCVVK